jgi:hypothetical protein
VYIFISGVSVCFILLPECRTNRGIARTFGPPVHNFTMSHVVPIMYKVTLYITAINRFRFQMILCKCIWNWFLTITRRKSVASLHTKKWAHTDSNYAPFPEIMPGWSIRRRSPCPCAIRRGSKVPRLLESWFRMLPCTWMSVSCEYCVLSCRGLRDEMISRPEEPYRLWYVICKKPQEWGGPGLHWAAAP